MFGRLKKFENMDNTLIGIQRQPSKMISTKICSPKGIKVPLNIFKWTKKLYSSCIFHIYSYISRTYVSKITNNCREKLLYKTHSITLKPYQLLRMSSLLELTSEILSFSSLWRYQECLDFVLSSDYSFFIHNKDISFLVLSSSYLIIENKL